MGKRFNAKRNKMKIKKIKFPEGFLMIPEGATFKEARQIARLEAQKQIQHVVLNNFYKGVEECQRLTDKYKLYL